MPTWESCNTAVIKTDIPGILQKDMQTGSERKAITDEFLHNTYPPESWIRIFTDGSAENAVKNGGGGIFIQFPEGTEEKNYTPTGLLSTNYKAETVALERAAKHINLMLQSHHNIVFLSDALSVLLSLMRNQEKDNNSLTGALAELSANHNVTLQWIPSHCDLYGNEMADQLAKEGSKLPQEDKSTSFNEVKTIIKSNTEAMWKESYPAFNPKDPYYN